MGRPRQNYSPEFKDEAVKLVVNTGRTVAAVARELGLKEQTLGRWVQAARGEDPIHDHQDGPVAACESHWV